jgi:hypothetical protein
MLPILLATAATQALELSGLVFTDYRVPSWGPAGLVQSFNVTRSMLTARARLDDVWSGVVQYNAYPLSFAGGAGATVAREAHVGELQLAYVQAAAAELGLTAQLGMIAAPWHESGYTYWNYRMLGTTLPLEGGFAASLGVPGAVAMSPFWDLGLKVTAKQGAWSGAVAVLNGEGFRAPEGDGQKSFQARLTYQPWPFLDLTLAAHKGNPTGAAVADRAGAAVTYHAAPLALGLEGIGTNDVAAAGTAATGLAGSAWGVVDLPIALASPQVLARVNAFNASNGAARVEVVAGLAARPRPGVTFVLDDQLIAGTTTAGPADANVTALHASFGF